MSRDEQRSVNDQQSREESSLALAQIVFIGRTYEEYMSMFQLTDQELAGKHILDCPGVHVRLAVRLGSAAHVQWQPISCISSIRMS